MSARRRNIWHYLLVMPVSIMLGGYAGGAIEYLFTDVPWSLVFAYPWRGVYVGLLVGLFAGIWPVVIPRWITYCILCFLIPTVIPFWPTRFTSPLDYPFGFLPLGAVYLPAGAMLQPGPSWQTVLFWHLLASQTLAVWLIILGHLPYQYPQFPEWLKPLEPVCRFLGGKSVSSDQ